MLFLIEASGGMTDDEYDAAVARQADSDEDKRNSRNGVVLKRE